MSTRTDLSALTTALHEGIGRLTRSQEWERFLAYQAAFHSYSFGNVVLIASQRPDATRVAGYATWQSFGRWVRRGESAIWILAPVRRRVRASECSLEDEANANRMASVVGFRRVAVFDIAQTDGAEPPEVVRRLTGSAGADAIPALVELARSYGFSVVDARLDRGSNGECDFAGREIRLETTNAPSQRVKTLVHELAHAILHEHETDRALAELEAESVAFVVCRAIGLDTGAYSFGYLASWAGGGEMAIAGIRRSGERIATVARAILGRLEADAPLEDHDIGGAAFAARSTRLVAQAV
jgi:antirestriction protein ArdC